LRVSEQVSSQSKAAGATFPIFPLPPKVRVGPDDFGALLQEVCARGFRDAVPKVKPKDAATFTEVRKRVVAKHQSISRQVQAALDVLRGLDDAPDSF